MNGNLKAEMVRFNITADDLRKVLNCTEKTVRNKIQGKTSFSIDEAFKIKKAFFPNLTLEYLFFNGERFPNAS